MIPFSIVGPIEKLLQDHLHQESLITETKAIGGGSINAAAKIAYGGKHFFVKWNHAEKFRAMFASEAEGLAQLAHSKTIKVPEVIGFGTGATNSFLLLGFIETAHPTNAFWEKFGQQLAMLHQQSNIFFGKQQNNYIGSLIQLNNPHSNWADFYINERLSPLFQMAMQHGKLNLTLSRKFDALLHKIPELFPDEKPSLLHGDLWRGNFLCSSVQEPVLIDPAVYFGFREMDIAMSKLFGGFHPLFYDAYHQTFPLQSGWRERIDLCNIYPLLVHVNLFGSGYVHQLDEAISYYI